jgi:hypothetical protein
VAVGSLAAIAIALGAAAGAAGSSPSTPPPCTAAAIVTWINTTGSGAAGSFSYLLEFTNLSGHTCRLTGYPGVSGVDLAGHQLGSSASRDPQHPAATITLSSATRADAGGTTATAVLQITDVANYPTSTCRPTTAAGLRIYAPGQTASTVVPFPFRACARTAAHYLSVQAVTKQATGGY